MLKQIKIVIILQDKYFQTNKLRVKDHWKIDKKLQFLTLCSTFLAFSTIFLDIGILSILFQCFFISLITLKNNNCKFVTKLTGKTSNSLPIQNFFDIDSTFLDISCSLHVNLAMHLFFW